MKRKCMNSQRISHTVWLNELLTKQYKYKAFYLDKNKHCAKCYVCFVQAEIKEDITNKLLLKRLAFNLNKFKANTKEHKSNIMSH